MLSTPKPITGSAAFAAKPKATSEARVNKNFFIIEIKLKKLIIKVICNLSHDALSALGRKSLREYQSIPEQLYLTDYYYHSHICHLKHNSTKHIYNVEFTLSNSSSGGYAQSLTLTSHRLPDNKKKRITQPPTADARET
jgi:hypothetical protein